MLVIKNARLIVGGRVCDDTTKALVIEDGYIRAITDTPPADAEMIDAEGLYCSAGFVELHTHGINGYDFMDADAAGAGKALVDYARFGVTGVYPTLMTASAEDLAAALDSLRPLAETPSDGAQFLGAHMEGPYFNAAQAGAQPPEVLRLPDAEEVTRFLNAYPFIRRWDLAPELEGAAEVIETLVSRDVVAGVAHTDADSMTILQAAIQGCTVATHLYSGMSSVNRKDGFRHGGAVEGCMLADDITAEAIGDGIHLPPELLHLTWKVKGTNRMALVTDSNRGAAMPEGSAGRIGHYETGVPIVVADGVAWLPDRSAFAGSIATMDRTVRTAVYEAGIPLGDAVRMATATPAAAMGLTDRGDLQEGLRADVVLFDDRITVHRTIVGGKTVYIR